MEATGNTGVEDPGTLAARRVRDGIRRSNNAKGSLFMILHPNCLSERRPEFWPQKGAKIGCLAGGNYQRAHSAIYGSYGLWFCRDLLPMPTRRAALGKIMRRLKGMSPNSRVQIAQRVVAAYPFSRLFNPCRQVTGAPKRDGPL